MIKNTFPSRLYWVFFFTEDLRQTVEPTNGTLIKEKIYRQLSGQPSSTTSMSMKDTTDCKKKTVLLDNKNVLDSKFDKLTVMMSKLTSKIDNQGKPFKLKTIMKKGKVKEGFIIMVEVGSKAEVDWVMETDSKDHLTEGDLSMDKISEKETSEEEVISGKEMEKIS